MNIALTKHAMARSNQRGFRNSDVALIVTHGSRWIEVGGGLVSVSLSKEDKAHLRKFTSAQAIERVAQAAVVFNPTTSSIVTVIKNAAPRYRRRWH